MLGRAEGGQSNELQPLATAIFHLTSPLLELACQLHRLSYTCPTVGAAAGSVLPRCCSTGGSAVLPVFPLRQAEDERKQPPPGTQTMCILLGRDTCNRRRVHVLLPLSKE